jgi:hypothetical protein
MTKIAIAGYRELETETTALVDDAIREELSHTVHGSHHDVVGISWLAPGVQQLFARAVADLGGELEVIVPSERYRDQLPTDCRAEYDALLLRARAIHRLPSTESAETAELEAGHFMLVLADQLFAIWDGTHLDGHEFTADLVTTAQERGIPVSVIWPHGARRTLSSGHARQ